MNPWIPRLAPLLAGAALMTACGGGGGGSSGLVAQPPAAAPPTPTTVPLVPATASPDTLLVASVVAEPASIADTSQPRAIESLTDDGDQNSTPVALGPKPADAAM